MTHGWKRAAQRGVLYALLVLFVFVLLFPFVWVLISSFMTQRELGAKPAHWIPHEPTLRNYVGVLLGRFERDAGPFGTLENTRTILPGMLNSVIVSVVVAAISMTVGGLAAYSMSRFKTRVGRGLYLTFISSRVLPPMTMILPVFIIFSRLGLINTPIVLILSYNIFILPFSIWMLKAYFDKVPTDIEEMALIDGLGRFGIIFRIMVPVAYPGFIAVFLMSMMEAWSELFYAMILTDQLTLPPILVGFQQMQSINWTTMAAATILTALPPVILALSLQNYIKQGLIAGAVKG